jgi:hypothetical protein
VHICQQDFIATTHALFLHLPSSEGACSVNRTATVGPIAAAAHLPCLSCLGAWCLYLAHWQALDTAVSRVVRFLLFKHHEKPGVPVKRQEISDVISVSDINIALLGSLKCMQMPAGGTSTKPSPNHSLSSRCGSCLQDSVPNSIDGWFTGISRSVHG